MKKIFYLLVFVFLVCHPQFAKAEEFLVNFNLDKATLAKGYTIKSKDDQLLIPIWPNFQIKENFFSGSINTLDLQINSWPEKLRPISAIYRFQFIQETKNDLNFYLNFQSDSENYKEVYVFDENSGKWEEVYSQINCAKNQAKAWVKKQQGLIAVFERVDDLTAESALVLDKKTGEIIFAKNQEEVRPMASLTKLMTVLVFLENNPGWNKKVVMQKADFVGGATLYAKIGDVVSTKDLFYATLVGSKNNAVEALIRATGLSRENFIKKMNEKAKNWGLTNTYYDDPTGLSEKNVSTAREMSIIAKEAFAKLDILKATTTKIYTVHPTNRNVSLAIANTSAKVLNRDLCITGSKTGYTTEAGYNLVTQAKADGREIIALVMGSEMSMNYEEVYKLLKKYL